MANLEDDYNSEEDEDYCPSEASSDEGLDGCVPEDGHDAPSNKRKGKKQIKAGGKRAKGNFAEEDEVAKKVKEEEEAERKRVEEEQKKAEEDQKKSRINDLWADLNASAKPKPKPAAVANFGLASVSKIIDDKPKASAAQSYVVSQKPASSVTTKDTVTVTQKYDFAGETIEVTKTLDKDSEEYKSLERKAEYARKKAEQPQGIPKGLGIGTSTAPKVGGGGGGGLDSLLSSINNKKKKMSTLTKSSLDWSTFKEKKLSETEKEEMEKQKEVGYLEKQAFLTRTDWRQFDNERSIRDAERRRAAATGAPKL